MMKKYKRISATFTTSLEGIDSDEFVSAELNTKLNSFVSKFAVKDYRIINVETTYLPQIFGAAEQIRVSMHIEY